MIEIDNANKVVAYLAIASLIGVVLFGSLSFFVMPAYQEGVSLGLKAMIEVVTFAAGVKAGLAIAKK